MRKLLFFTAFVLVALLLPAAGCSWLMPPAVETIRVMKTSPGEPPPPGGWAMTPSGAHPTDVQDVFQPGEKMMLGLSISDRPIGGEITFSGFTFFNRGTGAEQAIDVSPGDFGPWETGSTFLVGYHDLWNVPSEDGEYELRVYAGDKVVASALFNVGIRPASWGPEMEVFPAPVHDVSVVFQDSQAWALIRVGLPDSCTRFKGGDARFTDNTVVITLEVERPKDVECAQVYSYDDIYWAIGGEQYLPGETYTVHVNDFTTTFTPP